MTIEVYSASGILGRGFFEGVATAPSPAIYCPTFHLESDVVREIVNGASLSVLFKAVQLGAGAGAQGGTPRNILWGGFSMYETGRPQLDDLILVEGAPTPQLISFFAKWLQTRRK